MDNETTPKQDTAPGGRSTGARQQIDPEWKPPDWPRDWPDPDWVLYTFVDSTTIVGGVLAVLNEGSAAATTMTYKASKEYWNIDPNTIATATSVRATAGRWDRSTPSFPSKPSFPVTTTLTSWYMMKDLPDWTTATEPEVNLLFGVGPKTVEPEKKTLFGFVVNVNDDKKPTSWTWYNGFAGDTAPKFAVSGPTDLTYVTRPPEGLGYPTVKNWRTVTVDVEESGAFSTT